ncbi:YL1 nuclear protein [Cryptosporidium felis]|nr:YL1 nuclear protein [Cryptosporidium felis]
MVEESFQESCGFNTENGAVGKPLEELGTGGDVGRLLVGRGEEAENAEGEDEGSEDEEGEDEESEDEESEDEESGDEVEERKVLPERASRGKRYTQLLGEEEAKDSQFWGHDTWEEEEGDSGWSSEDEKIELEILGGIDSSTDSEEYDQSDDGKDEEAEPGDLDDDIIDGKKARKPKRLRTGKYKDPSLFLKSAQKDMLRKVKKKMKTKKKSSPVKKTPAVLEPRSMGVRASTTQKKLNLQESIKKRDEEALSRAKQKESRKGSRPKANIKTAMTQEERLEACKEIEKMNLESLNKLEEYEEQRRYLDNTSASMRKHFQSGSLSIYVSWSSYRLMESEKEKSDQILSNEEFCREMIIYTDGNIPPHISQKRTVPVTSVKGGNKEPASPKCFVFGNSAKYYDPLTEKYYSNLEAFRIIRKEYHSQTYKRVLGEMKEIQDLIQANKKFLEDGLQSQQFENGVLTKVE